MVSCAGEELLATANEALLLSPGAEYRVRHPIDGGDQCTVVTLSSDLASALGNVRFRSRGVRVVPVSAGLFREQTSILRAAEHRHSSVLETEERLERLVSAVATDGEAARPTPSPATRRRVEAARELIAAKFEEPLPLATIGSVVGLSPFHLSRAFRAVTGTSMHRYQTQLRMRAAVARLVAGEDDLTGLAIELGFSSHSHLTSAFGREFGVSPSSLRNRAGRGWGT